MNIGEALTDISAGILITDSEFKVIWANKYEENAYKMPIDKLYGLWVVDCHKEKNKEKVEKFLLQFKSGELKEFTKIAHKMVITYSAYYENGEFGGIVRTRIRLPE